MSILLVLLSIMSCDNSSTNGRKVVPKNQSKINEEIDNEMHKIWHHVISRKAEEQFGKSSTEIHDLDMKYIQEIFEEIMENSSKKWKWSDLDTKGKNDIAFSIKYGINNIVHPQAEHL